MRTKIYRVVIAILVYLFIYQELVLSLDKYLSRLRKETHSGIWWSFFQSVLFLFLFLLPIVLGIRWLFKRSKRPGRIRDAPGSELAIGLKTESGTLFIQNPFRGIFVVGAAGSGKSESIAVPLLQQFIQKGFAGIVYDFKYPVLAGEVNTFTSGSVGSAHPYYINFEDPYVPVNSIRCTLIICPIPAMPGSIHRPLLIT